MHDYWTCYRNIVWLRVSAQSSLVWLAFIEANRLVVAWKTNIMLRTIERIVYVILENDDHDRIVLTHFEWMLFHISFHFCCSLSLWLRLLTVCLAVALTISIRHWLKYTPQVDQITVLHCTKWLNCNNTCCLDGLSLSLFPPPQIPRANGQMISDQLIKSVIFILNIGR